METNYLDIFKRALKDPKLEGIDCICSNSYPKLSEIVKNLTSGSYISEWRYGMGNIKYIYRLHTNGTATKLKEAFKKGVRGGHPRLTDIYSKNELEKLIQKFEVDSE